MDVTATLRAEAVPVAALFAVVADLSTYPGWLDIVGRAEPDSGAGGDPEPAWKVDLRGQIGPLRRSKRLRMVRVTHEPDRLVTFERREVDGRQHSPWVLAASVEPDGDAASVLTMRLHYGGSMWLPLFDRLLADEIERSRSRLVAQVVGN